MLKVVCVVSLRPTAREGEKGKGKTVIIKRRMKGNEEACVSLFFYRRERLVASGRLGICQESLFPSMTDVLLRRGLNPLLIHRSNYCVVVRSQTEKDSKCVLADVGGA